MTNIDYSKGKIYKLISDQTDKVYIGSTTKEYLSQRFVWHKSDYNKWKKGTKHYVTSYEIMQYDDAQIILIENFPCKDVNELRSKERFWIENTNNCVNKCIPGRTIQEQKRNYYEKNKDKIKNYYEENKEEIIQQKTKYYHENKEKLHEKFECECGGKFTKQNKSGHIKTKKHQAFITKNQENEKVKENLDINNNANISTTILQ